LKVSTKVVKDGEVGGFKVEKAKEVLPTQRGKCILCGEEGRIRYFVACKLPKPAVLCDDDYLIIRAKLEDFLLKTYGRILNES